MKTLALSMTVAVLALIVTSMLLKNDSIAGLSPVDGAWDPIHRAAHNGDITKIERLLNRGVDINARTKHGWTPLHLAAQKNLKELVVFLIDRGADLDVPGWFEATPLQDAAANGHQEIGELLRAAGATIDVASAAAFGWLDELTALVDQEPEVLEAVAGNVRGQRLRICPCPMHFAARNGQVKAVELLLARGCVVDGLDQHRVTPLYYAAQYNHAEVIERLIQAGHEVDFVYDNEMTPLQIAAYHGQTDAVAALLAHGASPKYLGALGRTPLELEHLPPIHSEYPQCRKQLAASLGVT